MSDAALTPQDLITAMEDGRLENVADGRRFSLDFLTRTDTEDERSVFQVALHRGSMDKFTPLVEEGARLTWDQLFSDKAKSGYGATLLHVAAYNNAIDRLAPFLPKDDPLPLEPLLTHKNRDGHSIMYEAAAHGTLPSLSALLPEDKRPGIDQLIACKTNQGLSVLDKAAIEKKLETLPSILPEGAKFTAEQVTPKNSIKNSLCDYALKGGQFKILMGMIEPAEKGAALKGFIETSKKNNHLYAEDFLNQMDKTDGFDLSILALYKKNAPEGWLTAENTARLNRVAHRLRRKTGGLLIKKQGLTKPGRS